MQPDGGREHLLGIRHHLLEWRREIFAIESQLRSSALDSRPVDQLAGLRKVVLESRKHLQHMVVGPEAREKVDDALSVHDLLMGEIDHLVLKLAPDVAIEDEDEG